MREDLQQATGPTLSCKIQGALGSLPDHPVAGRRVAWVDKDVDPAPAPEVPVTVEDVEPGRIVASRRSTDVYFDVLLVDSTPPGEVVIPRPLCLSDRSLSMDLLSADVLGTSVRTACDSGGRATAAVRSSGDSKSRGPTIPA